jgi:hypothetical protein
MRAASKLNVRPVILDQTAPLQGKGAIDERDYLF